MSSEAASGTAPGPQQSGEVLIQQDGQVTGIDAPSLDDDLVINLDRDEVGLPDGISVQYDIETATDGGHAVRDGLNIRQKSYGLSEPLAECAAGAGIIALAAGGWLWGLPGSAPLAGAFAAIAGAILTLIGIRSGAFQ